jgi:hypothetical protein
LPWDQATELLLLLLPGSLALVLLLLLLLPNLAAEPFAAAAAVVVDVVGAAHVGVVADAGNAKREAGAGAGAVVVVLFVVAVAVVDDDDSKCVAAGDWGGCEPMKAREKSHERARKADEVQEDAASCPTETVGPHSLHTAPEIASSISLSLSLSPSPFSSSSSRFFTRLPCAAASNCDIHVLTSRSHCLCTKLANKVIQPL